MTLKIVLYDSELVRILKIIRYYILISLIIHTSA